MEEEQKINDKPSDNIIAQIIHRYLPFWPILIICATISIAISFFYLRSQTKIYKFVYTFKIIKSTKGSLRKKKKKNFVTFRYKNFDPTPPTPPPPLCNDLDFFFFFFHIKKRKLFSFYFSIIYTYIKYRLLPCRKNNSFLLHLP